MKCIIFITCVLASLGFVHGVMFSTAGTRLHTNDDGYSSAQTIQPFSFFGNVQTQLFVCTNGILTFGTGISSFIPTPFPIADNPLVAPFWGDVDTNRGGDIFYRTGSAADLSTLNAALAAVAPSFTATSGFIASWVNVAAYGGGGPRNTFQAALATDGLYSFAIFNYQSIGWTYGSASRGIPAQVGFDAGDRTNSYAYPYSRTPEVSRMPADSNVGVNGRFIFIVDQPTIRGANETSLPVLVPVLTGNPVLEGPIITGPTNEFKFSCSFSFNIEEEKESFQYKFEVQWLFGGYATSEPRLETANFDDSGFITVDLPYTELVGSVHMEKSISCQVITYWVCTPNNRSRHHVSNNYWIGVKAMSRDGSGYFRPLHSLSVDEADDEASHVWLQSTVPIVCANLGDCTHRFMVYSPNSLTVHQDLGYNCSYDMRSQDWNDTESTLSNVDYPLDVRTLVSPTSESVILDFIEFVVDDAGSLPSYWQGYAPPRIRVYRYNNYRRLPRYCFASGDPRMYTFDRTYYDMNALGQFIMAKSGSARGFEVDIRTHPCRRFGGRITSCVCGVAIREGDASYIISMCNRYRFSQGWNYAGRSYGVWRNPATSGWKLYNSRSGRHFVVTTPAGAQVRVSVKYWGFNVFLTVIGADYDKLDGICGTYNNNRYDDLRYYLDEEMTQGRVANQFNYYEINAFVRAWRIARGYSYFEIDPPSHEEQAVDNRGSFCSCVSPEEAESSNEVRCAEPVNSGPPAFGVTACVMTVVGGGTLSGNVGRTTGIGSIFDRRRRRRSIFGDDGFDFAENSTNINENIFPTPSGITEAEARAYCEETLTGDCGSTPLEDEVVEQVVNSCMADVRDLDSVDGVSDVFIGQTQFTCIMNIVQAVNNETNENNTIAEILEAVNEILGPVVTSMCPDDCNRHGVCALSMCTCDEGWTGVDCAIDQSTLPGVEGFPDGDVCDRSVFSCSYVTVETRDVYANIALRCRLEYNGEIYDMPAVLVNVFQVACDLPDIYNNTNNLRDIDISITRDGNGYGDSARYRIYDGDCLECNNAVDDCITLEDKCSIGGNCYNDQARHPSAHCLMCVPENYQSRFTFEEGCDDSIVRAGEYGEWGNYGSCSAACDYGFYERERVCLVADTCLDEEFTERAVCISFRCEEDENEVKNGVLVTVDGSTVDVIETILDNEDSLLSMIATKLNSYCVDKPEECCDVIDAEPSSPSMSVFTADDVSIASGTLTPNTDSDTTSLRLAVLVERGTLEAACGASRRRRDAGSVYMSQSVLVDSLDESDDAFESLGLSLVSIGEENSNEDNGEHKSNAVMIGVAIGCVLAAIVLVVIIAAVVMYKTKKNSSTVQSPRVHNNLSLVTDDQTPVSCKHKIITVAPPPSYELDGLAGGLQQAPRTCNTMSHKYVG